MTPGLVATASDEAVYLSKTLSKLLSEVYARQNAVLIDLGPAIGSNISYLAERVGCKIHVGDLYADLDRHAREGMFNRLPAFLERRFWSAPRFDCSPWGRKMRREDSWASTDGKPTDDGCSARSSSGRRSSGS